MPRIALLLLVTLLALPCSHAAHLIREQVSESVYVVRPAEGDNTAVSNAAFIVLEDRVLLFDTLSSAELMAEMLGLIGEVAKQPLNMIVLSHWHRDHSGGMDLLGSRPHQLIAGPGTVRRINESREADLGFLGKYERDLSRKMADAVDSQEAEELAIELRDVRREMGRVQRLPPLKAKVVVSDESEISFGKNIILIQHPGVGHTTGDLMVYVPTEGVLLAGDLVTVGTLPNLADAYTAEWLEHLDTLLRLGDIKVVPGHGPVGTKADIKALRDYLTELRRMVRPIAEGGTTQDLVEKLRIPPAYASWRSEDLWFPATLRVFQELKGQLPAPTP